MRLLNTFTGRFEWIEDPRKVRYAILSHTWSPKGEQSYQDVMMLQDAAQAREATEDPTAAVNREMLPHSGVRSSAIAEPTGFNGAPEISKSPARQPVDGPAPRQHLRQATLTAWLYRRGKMETTDDTVGRRDGTVGTKQVASRSSAIPISQASPSSHPAPDGTGTSVPAATIQVGDAAGTFSALPADPPSAGILRTVDTSWPPAPSDPLSRPQNHPRIASLFSDPALSPKIKDACHTARDRGYRFIWIDSCCIDKASSAELSEAINSMFLWYTLADVCFVYLEDVPSSPSDGPQTGEGSAFWESRWHTRGWTLQELIAPAYVLFLASDWSAIGTKTELASALAQRTGIDVAVLVHMAPLRRISVADRMRWASARETTRVEDEAYCLMGIFGVHIPTIYGEGRKAFVRLQEQIINTISDQSVFAWGAGVLFPGGSDVMRYELNHDVYRRDHRRDNMFLASSPRDYIYPPRIVPIAYKDFQSFLGILEAPSASPHGCPPEQCSFTAYGARVRIPCVDLSAFPEIHSKLYRGSSSTSDSQELGPCGCAKRPVRWLALLACSTANGHICSLPLRQSVTGTDGTRFEVGFHSPTLKPRCAHRRMVYVPRKTLRFLRQHMSMQDVCIQAYQGDADDEYYEELKGWLVDFDSRKRIGTMSSLRVVYAAGCADTLQRQGFILSQITSATQDLEATSDDLQRYSATISDLKSLQCIHLDLTLHRYNGPLSVTLGLRHFFRNQSPAKSGRPTHDAPLSADTGGIPTMVRELLNHPEEVDIWGRPGPPSPEEWVRPPLQLVPRYGLVAQHKDWVSASNDSCLYTEVLLCANRPVAYAHDLKVRILRITSRPVDYGTLHTRLHPTSREECEGPLVLFLLVELSEPLELSQGLQFPMDTSSQDESDSDGDALESTESVDKGNDGGVAKNKEVREEPYEDQQHTDYREVGVLEQ
ncbi:HET-domain-containing protein [Trametes cingulata]|nr:HET-domain-containing protein [Trametes cingulata]